jgi:hypothetical protein
LITGDDDAAFPDGHEVNHMKHDIDSSGALIAT